MKRDDGADGSGDMLVREVARGDEGGTLPNSHPQRIWGGPGVGAPCSLCGISVMPDGTELEIEFASDDGSGVAAYHVHPSCFATWEHERRTREPTGTTRSPSTRAQPAIRASDGPTKSANGTPNDSIA